MRNIFTVILINIVSLTSAQNLSIEELASLRRKNYINAEETLAGKGWNYIEGSKSGEFDTFKYTFGKNSYDNKAQAFLTYGFSSSSILTRINLLFFSDKKYKEYLSRVKAIGCKLDNSEIEEGRIIKYYKGKSTTFRFSISTSEDEFNSIYTTYTIMILDNKDYEYNFNPKNLPTVWEEIPTGDYPQVLDSTSIGN